MSVEPKPSLQGANADPVCEPAPGWQSVQGGGDDGYGCTRRRPGRLAGRASSREPGAYDLRTPVTVGDLNVRIVVPAKD